ncbi:phage baseplate assembly protein V [Halomonas sp. KAO]|uniref:phage baseplate assembly protein V n=1 Tax=Halomonas sp. KAO TaxID=2783858 RepID=UPI00189D7B2F|nr:phage baseplate assembly protein V [Halomonas sp. KAO]MBF7051753.1 phage baseplate assembly protein V [Halomonas sp. KAO]
MRALIEQLIADQLGPFQERMAEAQSGADDAQRRLRNQGRIGVISAVQAKPPRCKVKHGDNETPWIKWLTLRAGTTREWDPPTLGEQCLLLNYGGGDDGAQVAALCGLFSGAHPAPWDSLDVHGREYPDGTRFSYDHAEHRMTWDLGATMIVADRDQILLSSNGSTLLIDGGGVRVNGQRIDLN